MKLQEVSFKKITQTALLSAWGFAPDKSQYRGYITCYWNWMNSFECSLLSSLGEQLLWFSKNDLLRFHHIFLLFDTSKPLLLRCSLLLRSVKAYLCPNINFDGVNLSEHRSEEVKFLLMLSVCKIILEISCFPLFVTDNFLLCDTLLMMSCHENNSIRLEEIHQ